MNSGNEKNIEQLAAEIERLKERLYEHQSANAKLMLKLDQVEDLLEALKEDFAKLKGE